VQLIAGKDVV